MDVTSSGEILRNETGHDTIDNSRNATGPGAVVIISNADTLMAESYIAQH